MKQKLRRGIDLGESISFLKRPVIKKYIEENSIQKYNEEEID